MEELCRAMWRQGKGKFLAIAKDSRFSLFVRQFEYEELERVAADHRMRLRE